MLDERRVTVELQLVPGLNTVEVTRLHGVARTWIYQLRCDPIEEWRAFNAGVE